MGNGLKRHLTESFRAKIFETKRALDALSRTDSCKANYVVRIYPIINEGGWESINVKYKGSLCGAIGKAEQNFRKINGTIEVIGHHSVWIILEGKKYRIPREFWEQYTG